MRIFSASLEPSPGISKLKTPQIQALSEQSQNGFAAKMP
jgi:hypothetical protein